MLSGTGTTYQYISKAIQNKLLDANICLVVSSKENAGGVKYAHENNHQVKIINPRETSHHEELNLLFANEKPDLIVLAGYMHLWKLSPELEKKTINIHPSLIPAFSGKGMYGHHVHEAVIAAGVKYSGCTIHLVDSIYDHGQILEQSAVRVQSLDTADTLAARIQLCEKALLLDVISQWNNIKGTLR
jgi:phosphoribosylglycinamide formyltransferase 1